MKKPSPPKIKKVKGWAVVWKGGMMLSAHVQNARAIFASRNQANNLFNEGVYKGFRDSFLIIPCVIHYSLPGASKRPTPHH